MNPRGCGVELIRRTDFAREVGTGATSLGQNRSHMLKRAVLALSLILCASTANAQPLNDLGIGTSPANDVEADPAPPVVDVESDASVSVPAPDDAAGIAAGILSAFKAGQWVVGVGLALMLLGLIARRATALFAPEWAGSKSGGKIIGGGAAFASAIGLGLAAGGSVSVELVAGAIALAGTAAGLWSLSPKRA